MKIVGIFLGLVLLTVPFSADALTISEIEKKLLEAQSEDDVEKVILEIVKSKEYQQACQSLLDEMSSLPPPQKNQAYLDKALPILQDYENLKCRFTKTIWGDPPEQLSKTQCDELIVEFDEYNEKYYDIQKEYQRKIKEIGKEEAEIWLNASELWYVRDLARETKEEYRHKCIPDTTQCDALSEEKGMLSQKWSVAEEHSLESQSIRQDLNKIEDRITLTCGYTSSLMQYYEAQEKYLNIPVPTIVSSSEIICGEGTIENTFGQCVPDPKYSTGSKFSGGCLIATATFGSELSSEVQLLRELRDNTLLKTESGSSFMTGFNDFYYSFSPTIADWERQNPVFKEAVKITITPLISSLSLLNYVDMDSEAEVLGYGISLIILNVGMYVIAPVGIGFILVRKFENS